jgi:hypothetical protein
MDKPRPKTAITQLALTWLIGSMSTALVLWLLLGAVVVAWSSRGAARGTANGLLIGALVVLLAVPAVFYAVITSTREASTLGESRPRRALWAFLVFGGGLFGWLLGWAMCDVLGLRIDRSLTLAFLASGLPYALVAGVFLRGWAWRAPRLRSAWRCWSRPARSPASRRRSPSMTRSRRPASTGTPRTSSPSRGTCPSARSPSTTAWAAATSSRRT